jgi:hypothetical protein
MKAHLLSCSPRLLVPLAFFGSALLSQAAPKCDDISNDVRKAISSDTAKTLMIVEDALVISEACACEIVRAAIEASKADEALKQQIVQTALAQVTYSGKSGKDAKSVLPILPPEPVEDVEEFTYIPRDIRGIYLIAPGGVGVIGQRTTEEICDDDKDKDKDKDKGKHNPPHRRIISPISRSIATN